MRPDRGTILTFYDKNRGALMVAWKNTHMNGCKSLWRAMVFLKQQHLLEGVGNVSFAPIT
jgi:hypothetical protein